LEHERLRREKLEVQLDHTRQELEKAVKSLRDYETKVSFEIKRKGSRLKKFQMHNNSKMQLKKVVLLERFIQHTSKTESKGTKKRKQQQRGKDFERAQSAKSIKAPRTMSNQRGDDDRELSGFLLKKKSNSKTTLSSASTSNVNKSSKQKYLHVCHLY